MSTAHAGSWKNGTARIFRARTCSSSSKHIAGTLKDGFSSNVRFAAIAWRKQICLSVSGWRKVCAVISFSGNAWGMRAYVSALGRFFWANEFLPPRDCFEPLRCWCLVLRVLFIVVSRWCLRSVAIAETRKTTGFRRSVVTALESRRAVSKCSRCSCCRLRCWQVPAEAPDCVVFVYRRAVLTTRITLLRWEQVMQMQKCLFFLSSVFCAVIFFPHFNYALSRQSLDKKKKVLKFARLRFYAQLYRVS